MSAETFYAEHERIAVRTAARRYTCWTWLDGYPAPGEGYDGAPPCTRAIDKGEQHVTSTIYPGHDSGYAEDGPVTSRFCLPCAGRWRNLKRGIEALSVSAPEATP